MLIFSIAGLSFYQLVRMAIIRQIDTSLLTEKKIIEEQIINIDSVPDFSQIFGHQIEVTIYNHTLQPMQSLDDTTMISSSNENEIVFRHLLIKGNFQQHKGYVINILKSLEDTHKLIGDLLLIICFVLIALSVILILVNYWISKKVWIPFYHTLEKISDFDINENLELNLSKSGISEFDQLNKVLNAMSEKIRTDFLNLKEFTEDASHEIQTPLSIIKSKTELLFQSENLTETQSQSIQSIHEATMRLSKLSHSLLLISKIQNQQFPNKEKVNIKSILTRFLFQYKEIISQNNISVSEHYDESPIITMNSYLADMMISNLLGNAIKHNIPGGFITISLTAKDLIIKNSGNPYNQNPDSLFKRFRKGNMSHDSSGLGLSIVKKITTLYQMDIEYTIHESLHTITLRFNIS